jgi:hypothetical protein
MKHNFTLIIVILFALISRVNGQTAGTLDLSFGSGGKVVYDRDQTDLYQDVKVQPDGKIVAVGNSLTATYTSVIEVTRYLDNGAFDPSFGTNGHFNYTYNGNPETMAYRCLIKIKWQNTYCRTHNRLYSLWNCFNPIKFQWHT